MADELPDTKFPDHVDKAVRSVAQLHCEHRQRATTPQRTVNRIAALMGRPRFVVIAVVITAMWIGVSLTAPGFGLRSIDPPPFRG